jgi:outer membrane protein OmpA-like peptidoglycan-associated protein
VWGQWLAEYWSLHGQLYSPIQFMDSLRAVRPADMQQLLDRYLHAQPMVTAVLLNSTHAQQDFLTAYFDKDYVRQRQPVVDSTALLAAAQAKAQASQLQPKAATGAYSTRTRAGTTDTLNTLAAATPDSLLQARDADGKPLYARVSPDIPTVQELASYAIYYDFGKLLPDSSAEEIISRVVLFLNLNPGKSLVIRSHTDSPGSELANLQISERRAILLKQYIVSTYRIMPQRVFVKAMGEAKPAVQETDAASRRLNRRVEFEIR